MGAFIHEISAIEKIYQTNAKTPRISRIITEMEITIREIRGIRGVLMRLCA
jgi:hypothetical protein